MTVIEKSAEVVKLVWPHMTCPPGKKLDLVLGDAFTVEWPIERRWDFAWHDLWTEESNKLPKLHSQLLVRYQSHVRVAQGAWGMPRWFRRRVRTRRYLWGRRPRDFPEVYGAPENVRAAPTTEEP